MNVLVIFFYVFTLFYLRINGVEESKQRPYGKDVGEIEEQIQLHKNRTIKTIHTSYGDIYDCVDFYKQPAFDHPLFKNRKFKPQKIKPTYSHVNARGKKISLRKVKLGLNDGGCPDGTVPIRRVTKKDLVKIDIPLINNTSGVTKHARCITPRSTDGYTGATASLAVYNPPITDTDDHSAAVMRIQLDAESIEVGWRVDPKLYGDTNTRLYVYTDTGLAKCFDIICPGFFMSQQAIPLGFVAGNISQIGGDTFVMTLSILFDEPSEKWLLKINDDEIGFWPVSIFENPGNPNYVKWGGEVFAPRGEKLPPMGSGASLNETIGHDAFFANVAVINGPGLSNLFVDPINLNCWAESSYTNSTYIAKAEGNLGGLTNYLIFYGEHY